MFIHEDVPVTSFVLDGQLVGPWVTDLEKCWYLALVANPSRTMLVDLAEVSFIDDEGRALLATMRRKGARLLSSGVLINAIVAEIDAQEHNNGQTEKGRRSFAERTARAQGVLSDD